MPGQRLQNLWPNQRRILIAPHSDRQAGISRPNGTDKRGPVQLHRIKADAEFVIGLLAVRLKKRGNEGGRVTDCQRNFRLAGRKKVDERANLFDGSRIKLTLENSPCPHPEEVLVGKDQPVGMILDHDGIQRSLFSVGAGWRALHGGGHFAQDRPIDLRIGNHCALLGQNRGIRPQAGDQFLLVRAMHTQMVNDLHHAPVSALTDATPRPDRPAQGVSCYRNDSTL
ncbi:hypothetical protein GALL_504580 [mine drainage metagenome]|uniref:Uncharacterized protein n=1 Tax=mine drainage metagenome TaxID=410659 RepID=A0A1J5PK70_9ZZZZ